MAGPFFHPGAAPANKKPRGLTRGFVCGVSRFRRVLPEFVVDAGTDDVLGERDGRSCAGATREWAGLVAKIDVEVFDLGGPVRRECEFDAPACSPTRLCRAAERQHTRGSLEIAESGAARPVDQKAVKRIAGTAARGGEPVALGGATGEGATASDGVGGAIEVRPVAIGLDAQHELAPLVIAANRAADQEAVRAEVAGRAKYGIGPVAVTESIAAVDADIDAGPTEHRHLVSSPLMLQCFFDQIVKQEGKFDTGCSLFGLIHCCSGKPRLVGRFRVPLNFAQGGVARDGGNFVRGASCFSETACNGLTQSMRRAMSF